MFRRPRQEALKMPLALLLSCSWCVAQNDSPAGLQNRAQELATQTSFGYDFGQSLEAVQAAIPKGAKYVVKQLSGGGVQVEFQPETKEKLSEQVMLFFNRDGRLGSVSVRVSAGEKEVTKRCDELEASAKARFGKPFGRSAKDFGKTRISFTNWKPPGFNLTLTRLIEDKSGTCSAITQHAIFGAPGEFEKKE